MKLMKDKGASVFVLKEFTVLQHSKGQTAPYIYLKM